MIVGIHHTALSTRDADGLVRFYRDAFGFEVEFDFPWDEANEAFKQSHAVPESAGRYAPRGTPQSAALLSRRALRTQASRRRQVGS